MMQQKSDERNLGDSEFVESVLTEADHDIRDKGKA